MGKHQKCRYKVNICQKRKCKNGVKYEISSIWIGLTYANLRRDIYYYYTND